MLQNRAPYLAAAIVAYLAACNTPDQPTAPSFEGEVSQARQRPVQPIRYRALAGATQSVCGLSNSGEAFCWGLNNYGQLGNGSTDYNSTRPTRVAGQHRFNEIAISYQHGCGIDGGAAFCWGHNNTGQLGNPLSTVVAREPIRVQGSISFSQLSVGFFHTCGIGGAPFAGSDLGYCWGSSEWGQLGDNSAGVIKTEPTRISHDLRHGIDVPTETCLV